MKTMLNLALVGAFAATTLSLIAQPGNQPGPRGQRPPPFPLISVLDANHDRVIDAEEIANASAALATLDKNSDGVLTTNEFLPPRPGNLPGNPPADRPANGKLPPAPAVLKALDANGNGTIDATEIAHAAAALKKLDKNGDGKLTNDEFAGPRPAGRGGPQGEGGDENHLPPGPPPGEGDGNFPPPADQ